MNVSILSIQIPHLQLMSMAHAMKISTEFALGWDTHFHNHPDRWEHACVIISFQS